mmetsp:Transcript_23724/g.50774  ORF Transcript_23724/g.50774 Transcript_23724/m.50774 type:complete len:266 (-) Transcript_23724:224-1021(-)|eukprot:CAMPEP_0172554366 /NCGR_PEP_ID=MMETSP1067-20121228/54198_1 /TAXON_ID=265564 ORGANISM="Thalassiosira punctigera, Strain Tpunct2005C2" /NCGR_SAMPLE_ID=MMETSP1067 /ASSEMBLY_ACC=CAM_ASM_000444 /LENGTH=265 /DNA_ID=CAMNT_0013342717 /DNA_START=92 /DNA_END=889 /DNA_ORIENTATION=-
MGQICSICGSKEEPQRGTAFVETSSSDVLASHQLQPPSSSTFGGQQSPSSQLNFNSQTHPSPAHAHLLGPGNVHGELDRIEENEKRLNQYRLEQAELARREAIVTSASQSMVPVGSQGSVGMGMHGMADHHHSHRGGGINTYYDPAYAVSAAQDILRSAAVTGGLVFFDDRATQAAWNASVIGSMPMPVSQDRGSLANSKDVVETLGRGRWDGVRLGSRGSGLAGCGGEQPEYYLDDLAEAFLETMVPTKTSLFGGCPSIVENLP